MNDDTQLNREQLEAATSRSLPAGAPLDSETSALRDGFMALGHAVESAAADYDEAALIARVQSACRHEADVELPRRQSVARVAAVAQRCARGCCAGRCRANRRYVAREHGRCGYTASARRGVDSHVDPLTPTDESVVAGSWHDPLDEEIAAAQSSLTRLGSSAGGIDGTLSNMNQTLEAMSDELVGESL